MNDLNYLFFIPFILPTIIEDLLSNKIDIRSIWLLYGFTWGLLLAEGSINITSLLIWFGYNFLIWFSKLPLKEGDLGLMSILTLYLIVKSWAFALVFNTIVLIFALGVVQTIKKLKLKKFAFSPFIFASFLLVMAYASL